MTTKIYTDEEIVKALECCLCDNSECLQCQNRELCKMERDELATKTIDLIIRKTEEINRLKAEIERLKGSTIVNNKRIKREAKAEAYKGFAERLKKKIKTECNPYGKPTFDYDTSVAIMRYIDYLVKRNGGGEQ